MAERVASLATVAVGTVEPVGDDQAWHELLAALPPRQRAIVTLYYADDRAAAEIETLLGIAENTVKSALAKARELLRARLEDVNVG